MAPELRRRLRRGPPRIVAAAAAGAGAGIAKMGFGTRVDVGTVLIALVRAVRPTFRNRFKP